MSVPAVSKKATRKKMMTTAHICGSEIMAVMLLTPTPNVGSRLGAMEMMLSGGGIIWVTSPMMAVKTMP